MSNKLKKFEIFKGEDFIETKGNFTAEEIIQQPQMWLETAQILAGKLPEITEFMNRCLDRPVLRVCLTGAGSSGYCGEVVSAASIEHLGYKSYAPHTTDIVGSPETVLYKDVPTLLISFGRSGNSPESVGAVEYARKYITDLFEICVTCAKDSSLAKISEGKENVMQIVLPDKTCDKGFAMTSSFSSMAVAAYGILSYKNFAEFKNNITNLASAVSSSINNLCLVAQKAIAEKSFDRMAVLGAGILKGMSREASLKMCELTAGAVNVVSETPMGFRHGPKSMITDDTFIIHMISNNPMTKKYDIDLLKELLAHKHENRIITISGTPLDIPGIDYEVVFNNEFSNDFYFSVASVVFGQIFAFLKSQSMGITTDNPCPSGEVNRVVKGVTIY